MRGLHNALSWDQLWLLTRYVHQGLALGCADVEDDNTTVRRGSLERSVARLPMCKMMRAGAFAIERTHLTDASTKTSRSHKPDSVQATIVRQPTPRGIIWPRRPTPTRAVGRNSSIERHRRQFHGEVAMRKVRTSPVSYTHLTLPTKRIV